MVLGGLILGVAGFGLLALSRPRVFTLAFVACVAALFAVSIDDWTAATANVKAIPSDASLAQVLALVKASNSITKVPNAPPMFSVPASCFLELHQSEALSCVFGDTKASRTIVLYGDSHAAMWFDAVNAIAKRDQWRLVLLSKGACPAAPIVGHLAEHADDGQACEAWHASSLKRINHLDPDLLIVTQEVYETPNGRQYTTAQWRRELSKLLSETHAKRTVVLGNTPSSYGPRCLLHKTVRACSTDRDVPSHRFVSAEIAAAQAHRDQYVNVTPWFCTTRCSPVIGRFNVYFDQSHVALGYSEYLEGVLGHALGI